MTLQEEYDSAEHVFAARIESVDVSLSPSVVRYSVLRSYKTSGPTPDPLRAWRRKRCGVHLEKGDTYLVMTSSEGIIDFCSGSRPLSRETNLDTLGEKLGRSP